ncbi:hypothetical protein [Thermus thermophilus HB8]|uniref:Uncharacterized protein n=1 Tax=Thermus thermophilus (strain ATCC 27634 / DSM 579 / HB8) TaxID=300852 RepID=Q5SJT5_THET8|nr:hypothetical protein [Thermus thermophilus HB8]
MTSVAIPLRGSIPCNFLLRRNGHHSQSASRNPLTGLNPLQRIRLGPPRDWIYDPVAIPLRGSIPCNHWWRRVISEWR